MKRTEEQIRAAREYYDTHDVSGEIADAELTRHETDETSPLTGYSVRIPVATLDEARQFAKEQGVTTGAWLRGAIENAVAARKTSAETIPVSAILNLVQQYGGPPTGSQKKRKVS
ncbi:MAG: hypothetical protein J2P18_01175 [Nocardia sp.]|nr:hypothetical protein [Nocardia sp.]